MIAPNEHGVIARILAALLIAAAAPLHAQSYPAKPVRLIVPFAPGGTTDITARLMAQKMTDAWKQTVIVENRPGASGMIGADLVAKSQPDGYTVLVSSTQEMAINQHVFSRMAYNPDKDFAPVTLASVTPLILVLHPSIPARSVKELVALARTRPGQLTFASAGTGSVQHLAGELLKTTARIDMVHVPYKGAGPVMIDLVGGQVSMFFSGMPPAMPHVRAGKLRALAVTTTTRSPAAPEVPTMIEAGVAGFDISNWFGVFVPAGTPAEIVGRLNAEMVRALKQPDVKEKLSSQGAEPVGNSPAELERFVRAETEKYRRIVKQSGAKA
ncbi:MAG TPA: tripartite tricarboxylate transporter substrate binding protein, partial [Burkholderiales bacterium]|nr:tripartite tricarboxylate transporter substrate binding protein [Burkholderiales bacterium]